MPYKTKLVEIVLTETRRATWTMARHPVSGSEHVYGVTDENYSRLNRWSFAVRVPERGGRGIVVQPLRVPPKRVWAGLERRSVIWKAATIHPYRNRVYCKVNLADPSQERTKIGLRRGERRLLPRWFKGSRHRLRLKGTVTTTRGRDSQAQVLVVKKNDHVRMIKLFFALKVWVLEEDYQIVD